MSTNPSTTPWLRSARWAAIVAGVAWAAVGLVWVYKAAVSGNVLGAVAGAGLCVAVIILDCVAAAILRLGGIVLRSARRIEAMESRLTNLELALAEQEETVNLSEAGSGDPSALVAANLDEDAFPRLLSEAAEAPADAAPPPTVSKELEQLVMAEMGRLREEFALLVQQGDFSGALQTGERIATLFPDSNLASEYLSIREHLQRRAAVTPRGTRITAV